MSDIEQNAEPVAAVPKVKKPRTEKQIAATAALVARNKQKKADRQAAKDAEAEAVLQAVNLKIVEISAAEPDSDPDSDYELEATPQRAADESEESESSESESSSSSDGSDDDSDGGSDDSLSGDSSSDGGIPTESDSDDADENVYESDEQSNEDEAPKTYTPNDFASKSKDGGYMTHLEKANVVAKRKRPLHKGLLSRGW